ncbi:MAG: diguanylate cyclase [bacterium]
MEASSAYISTNKSRWATGLVVGFMALVMILFMVQVVAQHLANSLVIGITVKQQSNVVEITEIRPDSPAALAGIQAGEILQAINEFPIERIADISPAVKAADGFPSRVETLSGEQQKTYRVATGVPANYRSLLLNLLIISIYASIAIASLRAARVDRRTRVLAWFCFAVALDTATSGNYSYWPEYRQFMPLLKQMLAVLQFTFIVHLFSLIPARAVWMRSRLMPGLIYGVPLILHLVFTLVAIGWLNLGEGFKALASWVFTNNVNFISWGIVTMLILLYQMFRTSESRARKQAVWILLAMMPWMMQQASDVLVPDPNWVYSEWYGFVDNLTHLVFPIGVLGAIFRYNLLDAGELFPRQVFYRMLALILLVLPAVGVVEIAKLSMAQFAEQTVIWAAGSALFLLGISYSSVRFYLEYLLEGRRGYHQHHLGQQLRELAANLSGMESSDAIRQQLGKTVARLLNSRKVLVELNTDADATSSWQINGSKAVDFSAANFSSLTKPLQLSEERNRSQILAELYQQDLELVLPMQHQQQTIGQILVGRSLSGQRYSWREVELLHLFAQAVAAKIASTQFRQQAQIDPLTGVYRREVALDLLTRMVQQRRLFSVAMFDLDDFKRLNDEFGHLFGDHVLQESATIAASCLQESDTLARFGGEEFLMVFPDMQLEHAVARAECVRAAIALARFPEVNDRSVAVSVSVGVAGSREIQWLDSNAGEVLRELINLADKRLYAAKKAGKNHVIHSD